MPVQRRRRGQEKRWTTQQLTLFETRIALPGWGDFEPPTRREVVTTLATVLAEHLGRDRNVREASDE
jgi:hypothetical protein